MSHELRCYEYVNRPYAEVRDALRADPVRIFRSATRGAAGRATDLATKLRVEIGAVELGADVDIDVREVEEKPKESGRSSPVTRIKIAWKAARASALFPYMEAELSIYPLSSEETQLDLRGTYRPPLGAFGSAVDSLIGHRIAEASVHRFLSDVATYLKSPSAIS